MFIKNNLRTKLETQSRPKFTDSKKGCIALCDYRLFLTFLQMEIDEHNILHTVLFLDSINSESDCIFNLSNFSSPVLIGVSSSFVVEHCRNIKPTMKNWMQEETHAGSTKRPIGKNGVSCHWEQSKQEEREIQWT